ncbi:MAG: hypothetical protein ABI591_30395 [Kofleriaceae bacterium]
MIRALPWCFVLACWREPAPIASQPVSLPSDSPSEMVGEHVPPPSCEDHDCPRIPENAICHYACTSFKCVLHTVTRKAGAGPCYGDAIGDDTSGVDDYEATSAVVLYCDRTAGLSCEHHSRRCLEAEITVRALGEHCDPELEVCAAGAFCDAASTCVAKLADHLACRGSVECESGYCGARNDTIRSECRAPQPARCLGAR